MMTQRPPKPPLFRFDAGLAPADNAALNAAVREVRTRVVPLVFADRRRWVERVARRLIAAEAPRPRHGLTGLVARLRRHRNLARARSALFCPLRWRNTMGEIRAELARLHPDHPLA